jgi:hypothetical protein
MYAFAQDQHVIRRSSTLPTLMFTTECDILLATSMQFDAATIGWSTLMMTQMFCPKFLLENLSDVAFNKLEQYTSFGQPALHSLNDGSGLDCQPEMSELLSDACVENLERSKSKRQNAARSRELNPLEEWHGNPKNSWSSEDDERLLEAFKKHGNQWRLLSRHLKMGSDDMLRNRWERLREGAANADAAIVGEVIRLSSCFLQKRRRLRPKTRSVVVRRWTRDEDDVIIYFLESCAREKHPSWKSLSQMLRGRTSHAVRNRASRLSELGKLAHI